MNLNDWIRSLTPTEGHESSPAVSKVRELASALRAACPECAVWDWPEYTVPSGHRLTVSPSQWLATLLAPDSDPVVREIVGQLLAELDVKPGREELHD